MTLDQTPEDEKQDDDDLVIPRSSARRYIQPPQESGVPIRRRSTLPSSKLSDTNDKALIIQKRDIIRSLSDLPSEDLKEVTIRAISTLNAKAKDEVIQEISTQTPSQRATDIISVSTVVSTLVILVAFGFATIAAVFVGANANLLSTVLIDLLIFLGALLAPSPLQNMMRTLTSKFRLPIDKEK